MKHVRPPKLTAQEVFEAIGSHWTCPYCRVENTNSTPDEDIGWVVSATRQQEPRYICLGCCEDIYSACVAEAFDEHPYLDIVIEAATHEGLDVREFRKICLLDQLAVIMARSRQSPQGLEHRRRHIEKLLSELEAGKE